MFSRETLLNLGSRSDFAPLCFGLCLGITLSLFYLPPMDSNCSLERLVRFGSGSSRRTLDQSVSAHKQEASEEDFEPVQIPEADWPPFEPQDDPSRRLVRARFVSTEFGFKEKLFVAVLATNQLINEKSLSVAINKTLAHHVPHIAFFTNIKPHASPAGMQVVPFEDASPISLLFESWHYIHSQYGDLYDWFMLIEDKTYLYGPTMMEFVSHMSIGRDLYMGLPELDSDQGISYCRSEPGYILSRNLLQKVGNRLDQCRQQSWSNLPDFEMGRCLNKLAKTQCTSMYRKSVFHTYDLDHHKLSASMVQQQAFQQALSVSPMSDQQTVYTLHHHFTALQLNRTYKLIQGVQKSILGVAPFMPKGQEVGVAWPTGFRESFQPNSRYEVIDWEYFTQTHIYGGPDSKVALNEMDKADVDEIIATAVNHLDQAYGKEGGHLTLKSLINGYRRLDPTRGMEYTLDLELVQENTGLTFVKRGHLLRPLAKVEVIPMPYITEVARVHFVVYVTLRDQDHFARFLENFVKICSEKHENAELLTVFIYEPGQAPEPESDPKQDPFNVLKSVIGFYEEKFPALPFPWVSIQTSQPSLFALMEVVTSKFGDDALIFLTTAYAEFTLDLLNRCRMNTLQKWQVFFPVPFTQYNLELSHDPPASPPKTVEISRPSGQFDKLAYDYVAFYNSDYQAAVTRWNAKHRTDEHVPSDADFYDMFLQTDLHVFRAVEPALRIHYHPQFCHPGLSEESFNFCLDRRRENMASRSNLAFKLFLQDAA